MSLASKLSGSVRSRAREWGLAALLAVAPLASCGDQGNGTVTPPPTPGPETPLDPTLPPQNPSGLSAAEYWSSIGGHSGVDPSVIVAGSEDNSVAWFLDWLHDRIEGPVSGPLFSGSVGMTPVVAQTYVDRFGRFGNISDQSKIVIETYFDARDRLTQTVDERTGGPFIHPDTYVDAWDVGIFMPPYGQDLWYPVAFDSRPEQTGLPRNDRFLGTAFTDLNPEPNSTIIEQDAIDNWLSVIGYDSCSWNASQDWPANSPGFEIVIEQEYADSLPSGLHKLHPFPWDFEVAELRAYPGNTQVHYEAHAIDRAVWDADHMVYRVAHLAQPGVTYSGFEYDVEFGVPAIGQLIPPFIDGSRSVLANVSTMLSSRFADARILADPHFGESRLFAPDSERENADYFVVSPFDMSLSAGKRIGIADGGLTRRPVWDPSDPSVVIGWDYRAVSPCANSPDGLIYLPDDVKMIE